MSIRGKSGGELGLGVGLSLILIGVTMGIYLGEGFEWMELQTYDVRFHYRGAQDLQTEVLMVMNDNQTLDQLGIPPTKVSRTHYAHLVRNLSEAGAKLIVFDVILSGKATEAEDQALENAIHDAGNVILARYVSNVGQVVPLERFQAVELGEGLINVILDGDGVLRSIPLIGMGFDKGEFVPYLTLGAEAVRFHDDLQMPLHLDLGTPGKAGLGAFQIPYPEGRMLINYYGPPGTFPQMPLWKALKGDFERGEVQGKIILIGGGVPTLHDNYQTPFSRRGLPLLFHNTSHSLPMTGLEMHANVIETILDQNFLHRSPQNVMVFLIGALGLACGIMIMLFPQSVAPAIGNALLLLAGVLALPFLLFQKENYWLEMTPLIMVVNSHFAVGMGYHRYLLSRQKDRLERMFSQYVSPQVADLLWSRRTQLLNGERHRPEILTVTTVLAELEGFSKASEKVDHLVLLDWANSYLDSMGRIVMKYGGVIEEYGDGTIKAHFGVPVPRTTQEEIRNDAIQAAQCTLAMGKEVERVNRIWKNRNVPSLKLRLAMYTGQAVAGSVGNVDRLKYLILGGAVQMALSIQRWEENGDQTLARPTRVLAGETTMRYVDAQFTAEKVGEVVVDEQSTSMNIYQLLERKPSGLEETRGGKS